MIYAENIPPFGWKVIDNAEPVIDYVQPDNDSSQMENEHYAIKFDSNYNIISLYDRDNGREIVKPGECLNALCVYEDYPRAYDNWEISNYYKDKAYPLNHIISVKKKKGSEWLSIEIVRQFQNSVIKQEIFIYKNSRRIDVYNDIDWHEHHKVLKALFPVDIHANMASYDVQFGYVERSTNQNTSWDTAKFEVCAHKWADLSEYGYGFSVLNDCKYGYSVIGNEISLTLLKCGTHPNPNADQGRHSFVYSLYPHKYDFKRSGTIREAYIINRPMLALEAFGNGKINGEYSLIQVDSENIIVEPGSMRNLPDADNGSCPH